MSAQLALRGGGGALERVRRLTQMLAVAHELQLAERGWARRGDAARHDVGTRVTVVEGADRDGVGLAFHEPHEQPGELPEIGPFRVGSAPLGHFAGGARDRAARDLEQLDHGGRGHESRAR